MISKVISSSYVIVVEENAYPNAHPVQTSQPVIIPYPPTLHLFLLMRPHHHHWAVNRVAHFPLPLQSLRLLHHVTKPRIALMHPRTASVRACSRLQVTLWALARPSGQRAIFTRLTSITSLVPPLLVAVQTDREVLTSCCGGCGACGGRWCCHGALPSCCRTR
jgi:hypothetical protein